MQLLLYPVETLKTLFLILILVAAFWYFMGSPVEFFGLANAPATPPPVHRHTATPSQTAETGPAATPWGTAVVVPDGDGSLEARWKGASSGSPSR